MPSYFMLTGQYMELGSGAAGNAGRTSTNFNKVAYDSNGFLYTLKSNGDNASRVAFAPTIVDFTNTVAAKAGAVCIQPIVSRMMHWQGLWAASVVSSGQSDATDIQWVLQRGSASAAPIQTGTDRIGSTSAGQFIPRSGQDDLSSVVFDQQLSNFSDFSGGKFAYLIGASVTSSVATANVWVAISPR